MDSPELTKSKYLAVRRAQWRLKQRFETLEFEQKFKDEVEQLKLENRGEMPQIELEST